MGITKKLTRIIITLIISVLFLTLTYTTKSQAATAGQLPCGTSDIPNWNSQVTYFSGSFVCGSDNLIYSRGAMGPGSAGDPTTNPTCPQYGTNYQCWTPWTSSNASGINLDATVQWTSGTPTHQGLLVWGSDGKLYMYYWTNTTDSNPPTAPKSDSNGILDWVNVNAAYPNAAVSQQSCSGNIPTWNASTTYIRGVFVCDKNGTTYINNVAGQNSTDPASNPQCSVPGNSVTPCWTQWTATLATSTPTSTTWATNMTLTQGELIWYNGKPYLYTGTATSDANLPTSPIAGSNGLPDWIDVSGVYPKAVAPGSSSGSDSSGTGTINSQPGSVGTLGSCTYDSATGKSVCPSGLGNVTTDPEDVINFIIKLAIGVGGGIALVMIIFGGYLIMTNPNNPDKMQQGKSLITNAIIGLLLMIFSIAILNIIDHNVIGIPGTSPTDYSGI